MFLIFLQKNWKDFFFALQTVEKLDYLLNEAGIPPIKVLRSFSVLASRIEVIRRQLEQLRAIGHEPYTLSVVGVSRQRFEKYLKKLGETDENVKISAELWGCIFPIKSFSCKRKYLNSVSTSWMNFCRLSVVVPFHKSPPASRISSQISEISENGTYSRSLAVSCTILGASLTTFVWTPLSPRFSFVSQTWASFKGRETLQAFVKKYRSSRLCGKEERIVQKA